MESSKTISDRVDSPKHSQLIEQAKQIGLPLVLAAGLALGLTACATSKSGNDGGAHSSHSGALELNSGQKWVVVQPMMAHLRNIEKAVQEAEAVRTPDHAALSATIQEHLGRLVTNCTMEGKAHDELHKWLMPFLGLSADYSGAVDSRVQEEKFQEIRQALIVFNAHFQ